ncbi:MAG: hypothetical protein WCV85_06240 [Patescibacteria group bacterium]
MTEAPNKLFLLKKEKMWGVIGTIVGIGVAGLVLKLILPTLIAILQGLLTSLAYGIAVAVMGGILIILAIFLLILIKNSGNLFTIYSKKISKAIIRMGPLELMEGFAQEYLDGKLEESAEGIKGLKAAIREQDTIIEQLKEEVASNQEHADFLMSQCGNDLTKLNDEELGAYNLASKFVDDSEESIKRLQSSRDVLFELLEALKSLHQTLDYNAKYIRQTVRIKSIEYRGMQSGERSARAAQRVLLGGKELRDFNMAADIVREDISRMAGEIDTALDLTKRFTTAKDLSMAIAGEKMRKRILALRSNAEQMATKAKGNFDAAATGDPTKITEHAAEQRKPVIQPSRFGLRNRNQQ